ncbi:hypothetical protein HKCCSP123_01120 [Rhodobacterales bacterium HKCCSP123]|nr:hypothetical protein [Rhodobacterales bacterium HKCCSP123]
MPVIQIDPDILIVIATLVTIFATSSVIAGWVERSWPWLAVISLAIGLGIMAYVHLALRPGGLTFWDIPNAFIHLVAMVMN